jgi:hypothetical protein
MITKQTSLTEIIFKIHSKQIFGYHQYQGLHSPASIIHTTFWRRGQVRASRILGLEIWVRNDAVSSGGRYGSPWQ